MRDPKIGDTMDELQETNNAASRAFLPVKHCCRCKRGLSSTAPVKTRSKPTLDFVVRVLKRAVDNLQ